MDRCERAYVAAAETATRRSSTAVSADKAGTNEPAGADAGDVSLDGVADPAIPIKKPAAKKPTAKKPTAKKAQKPTKKATKKKKDD